MKVLNILMIAILAVLGAAAGVAKLLAAQHEVAFFAQFGLGEFAVILAGAIQVVGAVGLVISRFRLLGAVLTALCFGVSSMMIIANGQTLFGAVSLLPVGLSIYVAWSTKTQAAS